MRISELIKQLNQVKREHGDLLVGMLGDWTSEVDEIEYVPQAETGFYNPQDGKEYVAEHVLLTSGKRDRIFYRIP